MTENFNQFVPDVHFELIPINQLVSNQEYQRALSQKHVRKAAEHFDLFQVNPVKVSRRDGLNYVFNGQHTIEIIAAVSGSRETPVWCMIYDQLNYEHEADIFANQQKYVKPLTSYEIFNASVEAGDDKQLLILQLVQSNGLTITKGNKDCGINAIGALERIFDKYGMEVLDRTIRLLAGVWEGEARSLSNGMLSGTAKLVYTFGDRLSDDTFKEKLSDVSTKEILRSAKDRGHGSYGYAEAILTYYNRKHHGGAFLSMAELYEKKPKASIRDTKAEIITTDNK